MTELMKIDQSLTKEDLQKISEYSQSWYDYHNVSQFYDNDIFYKDTCTLLYFNYKTTKKFVYKKKILEGGGSKIIEKDDQFNPPAEMMEEGISRRYLRPLTYGMRASWSWVLISY